MSGTASKKCAGCGAEVPAGALWGLCAKCLFDEADKISVAQPLRSPRGRRFGDYELGDAIGRGGMGLFYEATQTSLHRPVALKMIIDSEAASPVALRRFTLEAEAAAKLDHPNIVPIYEVGEHDGQPFLSMKLVSGENLRTRIAKGDCCLAPKDQGTNRTQLRERGIAITRLLATVARAVHHAHEHGVLHRDLKPANIIVDRNGQPHLTDFGLAKLMDAEAGQGAGSAITISGTALGTPSYMSPEQATGTRLSRASDIYSLGAMLYEMLAGQPPFRAGTPLETLRLAVEQPAKRPSSLNPRVDKDLDTICLKCLEKNPAARYPTAEALADDLERWLRQEPIHARPAGVVLRARRWVARNRVGTALIVSLCTGLAVALVLLELALARKNRLDLHRINSVQRFSREIEEMWKNSAQPFVLIRSPDLAELADLPPRPADVLTTHLTLGISINHEPLGQAKQFAPFLSELEGRLEKILHRPVLLDLRLYKSEADSTRDVAQGGLALQRTGAYRYVLAKELNPGLEPIVRERGTKEAVIFASKDSGITNLAGIAGKRVAFGDTNSMISFWAKVYLARAGIRAANLGSYVHLSGTSRGRDADPSGGILSQDRDADIQGHKRVIQEVLADEADMGEAPRRNFELNRYKRHGLVPLLVYSYTSDLYVARPGLEPDMVRALRESLASFQSRPAKKLVALLGHNVRVEGFEAVSDHDFDDLRLARTNEVAEFEGRARNQGLETPAAVSR